MVDGTSNLDDFLRNTSCRSKLLVGVCSNVESFENGSTRLNVNSPDFGQPSKMGDASFEGIVVAITGVASGMGYATVKMLAQRGAAVLAIDVDT